MEPRCGKEFAGQLERFARAAQMYCTATLEANCPLINEQVRIMQGVVKILKRDGDVGVLAHLCADRPVSVRLMAAAYVAGVDRDLAIRTLRALQTCSEELVKFEASQCLSRILSGQWNLYEGLEGLSVMKSDHSDAEETNLDVLEEARKLSSEVKFKDIKNFDGLDNRVGWVNVHFHNLIGVNEGFIEFCPDSSPPLDDERLAFLWIVRPDLTKQIKKRLKHPGFAAGISQRQ